MDEKPKHTPGPWGYSQYRDPPDGAGSTTAETNARLIAAAPALVAACREFVSVVSRYGAYIGGPASTTLLGVMERARAALALAEKQP